MSAESSDATARGAPERELPAWRRFGIYLSERFPPLTHGLLIAAFAGSGVCVAALARGDGTGASWLAFAVAFVVTFLLFFQLRVADEHKDLEDDSRHRPERAVPRGLISLRALRRVALTAATLQLIVVLVWHATSALFLLACWAWMALMTWEFFAPAWLKARPVLYLVSHMIAMPLFALLAFATEWLPATGANPWPYNIVAAFLLFSFANGVALEVARKCRAPETERAGVETYSSLWGAGKAGRVVAATVGIAAAVAMVLNRLTDVTAGFSIVIAATALIAIWASLRYATKPDAATATRIDLVTGLFVLIAYLAVGPLPVAVAAWSQ